MDEKVLKALNPNKSLIHQEDPTQIKIIAATQSQLIA